MSGPELEAEHADPWIVREEEQGFMDVIDSGDRPRELLGGCIVELGQVFDVDGPGQSDFNGFPGLAASKGCRGEDEIGDGSNLCQV